MFIGGIASLIFLVWMVARIWKQSMGLALVSLFFWPALIFALFKFWGDDESDIKVPFFLFVIATGYAWYDMAQMAKAIHEEPESLLSLLSLLG